MDCIHVDRCPICDGEYRLLACVPTINRSSNLLTELRECTPCGHWWHSPAPSAADLNRMYREASPFVVGFGRRTGYPDKHWLDGFSRFAIASSRGVANSKRLYLELGVGSGSLLRRFEHLGYRCWGVDPAANGRSRVVESIDALPQELRFSVIVLQDVLEHVRDPVEVLCQLHGRADSESIIICSFPLKDCRLAKARRERWRMILPFGHLHYFSHDSAVRAFALAGWTITKRRLAHPATTASLVASGRVATAVHELIRGGRDQLYVTAVPSRPVAAIECNDTSEQRTGPQDGNTVNSDDRYS